MTWRTFFCPDCKTTYNSEVLPKPPRCNLCQLISDHEKELDVIQQRCLALENDLEEAGTVLGAVIVASTLRKGEALSRQFDHAAVAAVLRVVKQRDEAVADLEETLNRLHTALSRAAGERDAAQFSEQRAVTALEIMRAARKRDIAIISSLLVVQSAAREYLMRSGIDAENKLREALADLEMTNEPDAPITGDQHVLG